MFRWLFGRAAPPQPDGSAWFGEADIVMASPSAEGIAQLRSQVVDPATAPDLAESQDEMIDGLERLLTLAHTPELPVVPTQHRVIGQSIVHFLTPASLVDHVDASGKLFVTAERLLFSAGRVQQWPWHSITAMTRVQRDLVITARGGSELSQIRLNSFGDAMMVVALADRLRSNRP